MLQSRQNFHRSILPKIGKLVILPKEIEPNRKNAKCIVESYPLCDNVLPYSKGIHTVNVRVLSNNLKRKISGFYLVSAEY